MYLNDFTIIQTSVAVAKKELIVTNSERVDEFETRILPDMTEIIQNSGVHDNNTQR